MKKKGATVFTNFTCALSSREEYRRAGYSKLKTRKIAHRAALRVVVWRSVKELRAYFRGRLDKSIAACWFPESGAKHERCELFGPIEAEVHFVLGSVYVETIVHEITHAVGALPRSAGDHHSKGKRGEISAYRMDRLIQLILLELEGLGVAVPICKR